MVNACGVEHIIRAMRHGYVQFSRPDCTEVSHYRRKELRLIAELSSNEGSQSAASEMEHQDLFDEEDSDQEVDLVERDLAGEGPVCTPASDHSDDLCHDKYGATCGGGNGSVLGGASWRPLRPEAVGIKRAEEKLWGGMIV